MLHERDALALDRPRDERLRRVVPVTKARERRPQRRVVVTVDRLDVPAERAELPLEIAERDDLLRRLVRLHLVAVDDDPQPAEALVRGRLQRLPVLALLELPVPGHDDDPPATTEQALRERDPAPLRDAHPERSRARLDPGHADVRMPVEPAQATQPEQTLARDDTEREEHRVQPGHVVALRREEDVAVGVVETELGDVQLVEQEVRDDVERAEGGAEVARAGALHGDEGVETAGVGEQRELRVGIDLGRAQTIELGLRDEAQIRHVRHETVADALARLGHAAAHETCPLQDGLRGCRARRGSRCVCWPPVRIEGPSSARAAPLGLEQSRRQFRRHGPARRSRRRASR